MRGTDLSDLDIEISHTHKNNKLASSLLFRNLVRSSS